VQIDMKNLSQRLLWALSALLMISSAPLYAQDGDGDGDGTEEPTSEEVEAPPKPLEEKIIVNQRKPFIHTRRSEVTALAGATANDPFLVHYSAGGSFQYYVSDVLSVGVQGQKYFETNTGLSADTIGLNAVPDLNKLEFYGGVHFSYVPVYGKFALFNQNVVAFDTFVSLGAGITGNRILQPFGYAKALKQEDLAVFCGTTPGQGFTGAGAFCETDANGALVNQNQLKDMFFSFSPSVGGGFRFILNDFMGLTLDAKDYFIQETTLSGAKLFTQNVVVSVGTSFFFPTTFQYQTAR
jgi:outer membrane beta-barrel protein